MQTNSFEELLPVGENQIGNKVFQTVSARNLHNVLSVKKDFSSWVKYQLKRGFFEENIDFIVTHQKRGVGAVVKEIAEYFLTLNTAKEIAMMTGTKKGKEVRNYFIRIEETFLQLVGLKSKSEAEMHLFKNLDNIDLILKDMDTMNSVFEKLETAHKFLNTKNILELYRMDKFTQKIMNFSIFEVFGINLNEMFFIPTELGKILDKSAVEINKILEHKGYQIKVNEQWQLTEKGKEFAITVKNKLFTQIKWKLEAVA